MRPVLELGLAQEAVDICRELHADEALPQAVAQLGWALLQTGDLGGARTAMQEAVALHHSHGNAHHAAVASIALGFVALYERRLPEARSTFEQVLTTFQEERDHYFAALSLLLLAGVDIAEGLLEPARDHCQASLAGYVEIDNPTGAAWALGALSQVAVRTDQPEAALRLAGASEGLRQGASMPALTFALFDDDLPRARVGIEAARADELVEEGRRMSLGDAVAYAMRHDAW